MMMGKQRKTSLMQPIKPDTILEFTFEAKILDFHSFISILTLHLLTILSTPPAVIILLFVGLRKVLVLNLE
jgi:hypothetical protein